jgi:hypothetical protein
MIVLAANFIARRIEARRRIARAVAAAAEAADAGEDAEAQEAAYQLALTAEVYAVPRLALFLFIAVPWLLCFFFLPVGRYIDILHATLKSVTEEQSPIGLRRNAALVTGSAAFVRDTLPSQLHLFRDTRGGLDVFAILLPTGDTQVDTLALEWMLTEPDVVAARLLTTDEVTTVGATAIEFIHQYQFPGIERRPSETEIDDLIFELVSWRVLARLVADEVRRAGHKYHHIISMSTQLFLDTVTNDAMLPNGINLEMALTQEKLNIKPIQTIALRGAGVGAVGLNSELLFFGPQAGNSIGVYNPELFFGPAGLVYRVLERALPSLEALLVGGVPCKLGAVLHAVVESAARELGSNAAGPLTLLRYELPIALHNNNVTM